MLNLPLNSPALIQLIAIWMDGIAVGARFAKKRGLTDQDPR